MDDTKDTRVSNKPTEITKKVADESRYVVEWVTRILAICVLMGLIVWGGMALDKMLGTSWLTPVAVILGMIFCIAGLLLVVKRMEMMSEKKELQDLSQANGADTLDSKSFESRQSDSRND